MEISQAIKMGEELLEKYDLEGWIIKMDGSKRRFGQCRSWEKTISLSKTLVELNSEERVKNTLLHEIAHALTKEERGHGREWRKMALFLGIKPKATYSYDNTITPETPFTYICQKCGFEYGRYRAIGSFRLASIAHVRCGGGFKIK